MPRDVCKHMSLYGGLYKDPRKLYFAGLNKRQTKDRLKEEDATQKNKIEVKRFLLKSNLAIIIETYYNNSKRKRRDLYVEFPNVLIKVRSVVDQ